MLFFDVLSCITFIYHNSRDIATRITQTIFSSKLTVFARLLINTIHHRSCIFNQLASASKAQGFSNLIVNIYFGRFLCIITWYTLSPSGLPYAIASFRIIARFRRISRLLTIRNTIHISLIKCTCFLICAMIT